MLMIERADKPNHIKSGFDRSPVVSITGLKQSGKTTWLRNFRLNIKVLYSFDLEDPRSSLDCQNQ